VAKLAAAVEEATRSPAVIERARATGMELRFEAPAQLDETVKKDLAYWSKVIRSAGITAD
jgi:tripartite-type tricarboxylate transporter receptor subunit TctC